MKTCETCFGEYAPEKFDACPICARLEGKAPALIPAAGPRPSPVSLRDSPNFKLVSPALQLAESRTAPKPEPEPAQAAPSPPSQPPPVSPPPPPPPPPPAPAKDETVDSGPLTLGVLEQLRQKGLPIIVLLGFPTAGKTWFLQRLKNEMGKKGFTHGKKAQSGSEVKGTLTYSSHRFQGGKDGHDYVLIDLPGERFLQAVKDDFLGETNILLRHVLYTGRAFLVLLPADEVLFGRQAAVAVRKKGGRGTDAEAKVAASTGEANPTVGKWAELDGIAEDIPPLVKKLRAAGKAGDTAAAALIESQIKVKNDRRDELVESLSEDAVHRIAENEDSLCEFTDGIGLMAKIMSLMRHRQSPDLPATIAVDDIDDHMASADYSAPQIPMFVVLAKADVLEDKSGVTGRIVAKLVKEKARRSVLKKFSDDPPNTIAAFRPQLAEALKVWFEQPKIDFASAFAGHRGGFEIDYDLPHRGIDGIIDWVLTAMNPRGPSFSSFSLGLLRGAGGKPRKGGR
jgi:hypothetical protein